MNLSTKAKVLVSLGLILFISIPITLALLQKPQNDRSNAAAATTLSLIPQPGPSDSIEKTVGNDVPIDVKLDPGSNTVTILRLQVSYDQTKLQADATAPFTPAGKFSIILQSPPSNGKVSLTITTGSSPNDAVQAPTTAGTFHFKAIGATGGSPTVVAFTSLTQAFSADSQSSATTNVLSSSNPANITIDNVVLPSATTTPAPTAPATNTHMSFTILLDGIGKAGDTPNPTANDLSNKTPKHPDRQLQVTVFDSHNTQVAAGTGTISFVTPGDNINDSDVGTFKGTVTLNTILANGRYTVKVKSDPYLRKAFPAIIAIDNSTDNILPPITLVDGDTDGNNALDVADYNALLDCGYGSLNPLPITNQSAEYNSDACKAHEPRGNIDLNDDGFVNAFDYNLFVRELSVQSGD